VFGFGERKGRRTGVEDGRVGDGVQVQVRGPGCGAREADARTMRMRADGRGVRWVGSSLRTTRGGDRSWCVGGWDEEWGDRRCA
jgi:hypothetical protein